MKELDRIYQRRKKQLLPMIFVLAAFFILFRIILPQWEDIQNAQSLLSNKQRDVDMKEDNLLLLNSLPADVVERNFEIVSNALPLNKNIVLIFSQLESVAQRSGVELGGFTVKVGDVYNTETTPKAVGSKIDGLPSLSIGVNISGENNGLRSFGDNLYESLPIAEINSVDISRRDARYEVKFYYKQFEPSAKGKSVERLVGFDKADEVQLEKLSSWMDLDQ